MQAGAGLPSWREDSDEPQVHRSSISTNEAESLGLVGRISSVVMKAARRSLLLDSGADRPMLLKGTEHSRGDHSMSMFHIIRESMQVGCGPLRGYFPDMNRSTPHGGGTSIWCMAERGLLHWPMQTAWRGQPQGR